MHRVLAALMTIALAPQAWAGSCDAFSGAPGRATGTDLVKAYKGYVGCDKAKAEAAFEEFGRASGDTATLVDLALVAIDGQSYTPVWGLIEKLKDYNQRDELARGVGAACDAHPEVVTFLKGAYYGLRDIQFGQWVGALNTCKAEPLAEWVVQIAAQPPTSTYDEKYATVLTALVKKRGPDALPVLQRAAVESSTHGGPFNAIIEKMDESVQPSELGADITPENRQRLEAALVAVANAVGPEQAAMVADRLFNAGATAAAASLLPRVYPDRVQADGRLLYGVAAVESCGQQAIVHWSNATDPAARWSVLAEVEAPARAAKPRLKCTAEGPWPVLVTPEPVASPADVSTWVAEVQKTWTDKGFETKGREEKAIVLP